VAELLLRFVRRAAGRYRRSAVPNIFQTRAKAGSASHMPIVGHRHVDNAVQFRSYSLSASRVLIRVRGVVGVRRLGPRASKYPARLDPIGDTIMAAAVPFHFTGAHTCSYQLLQFLVEADIQPLDAQFILCTSRLASPRRDQPGACRSRSRAHWRKRESPARRPVRSFGLSITFASPTIRHFFSGV